jgi:serine/threonine protein phosphatase 1
MSTYCIGDIHGCSATLSNLLESKIKLNKGDKIIFLGDYIDRGPDSKGVLEIIMDLYAKNYDVTCLLGNHEELFMESEHDDDMFVHWFKNCGGFETLKSFNAKSYQELSEVHQYFFKTLLHYKIIDKRQIFVHAGLNFKNENIFEDKYSMLWTRDRFVNHEKLGGRILIHGHTPQTITATISQLERIKEDKIINLDTGCVFRGYEGMGYLTAFNIEKEILCVQECVDRIDVS